MAVGEKKNDLTEERVVCPNPDCTFVHFLAGCPIRIDGLYCRSEQGRWHTGWGALAA